MTTPAFAMATQLVRDGWRSQAACLDEDPELFFPVAQSGPKYVLQVAEAKSICRGCPVATECLLELMDRVPHGIIGGLTPDERQQLRRDARGA